jgi:hypothetical protein
MFLKWTQLRKGKYLLYRPLHSFYCAPKCVHFIYQSFFLLISLSILFLSLTLFVDSLFSVFSVLSISFSALFLLSLSFSVYPICIHLSNYIFFLYLSVSSPLSFCLISLVSLFVSFPSQLDTEKEGNWRQRQKKKIN